MQIKINLYHIQGQTEMVSSIFLLFKAFSLGLPLHNLLAKAVSTF